MKPSDIIATIGVSLLLLGFLLQSLKVIKANGMAHSVLNLIGAAIAGYASYLISFFPFVVLEGVWGVVALYNIIVEFKGGSVSRGTDQ